MHTEADREGAPLIIVVSDDIVTIRLRDSNATVATVIRAFVRTVAPNVECNQVVNHARILPPTPANDVGREYTN